MTERLTDIKQAANLLKTKEVVAFPTETVYGLGADATSDEAVGKIFSAKGRPSDNPLIVHIGKIEQLEQVVSEVSEVAKVLVAEFWPGPLTLILPKKEGLSKLVTAGLETVGVRMPNHLVALNLLREAQLPIAAPSANASGRPSPTTAKHVLDDLDGKIAGIIDGGATGVGVESTVLDCTTDIPIILRPGGVTKEQLEAVIGLVHMDASLENTKIAPKSPGMKYTHYAPDAPLTIIKGSQDFIQKMVNEARNRGKKVGILTTEESKALYEADIVLACGNKTQLLSVAQNLYEVLRAFNDYNLDLIYSECFTDSGLGEAIMNRLVKASGHRLIEEK